MNEEEKIMVRQAQQWDVLKKVYLQGSASHGETKMLLSLGK